MALTYTGNILNWPTHIKPSAVNLGISQPTFTSRALSGKKYVRSFNYAKQALTVQYPPMSQQNFQTFYAAVMALRGDLKHCWFSLLGTDSQKYLFRFYGDDTMTPAVKTAVDVSGGNLVTQVELKSLPVSTSEPIPAGSVISGLGRNYGHVQTVIACTDSDGSGDATITLAHPLAESIAVNDPVDVNPTQVLVSLTTDTFDADISRVQHYGFSVEFEFDRTYD